MSHWHRPLFGSPPSCRWPVTCDNSNEACVLTADFSLSSCLHCLLGKRCLFSVFYLLVCFFRLLSLSLFVLFFSFLLLYSSLVRRLISKKCGKRWQTGKTDCKKFHTVHEYRQAHLKRKWLRVMSCPPPKAGEYIYFYKKWSSIMIRSSRICFTRLSLSPITRRKIK